MKSIQYEEALAKLNARQRKAVETIYGPLMVIAGPGTGKTQLLSTRVGYILNETDLRPFNILCISYTNSGVAAMKKRLVELIGVDGHDVEVYTFHSFAEKVIQRYRSSNELEDFQFLDELDKKIIVRELLEKIDFNTPLKKGVTSVDHTISFLISFFNQIKREKYDIDELIASYEEEKIVERQSEAYIAKKAASGYVKGDFRDDYWRKYENKVDKHIQACKLFKEYQDIIAEKKLIDFDDLILQSIQLLQENDDLRYDFQEQYQMILIDEFQDTNGSQLAIVNELCRDNDDPNVMVVGDEDQSIYRFQGANVYNIHDFYERYLSRRPVEEQLERIVVLEENYRSTPIVLESSRMLIENNSERITNIVEGKRIIKKLEAAHEKLKHSDEAVEYIEVNNKADLGIPIALEIERLVRSGMSYSDIAVLFPSNDKAKDFSTYLKILDYPFELSKEEDILQDPLIQSYMQVFRLILFFIRDKYIDRSHIGTLLMYPWMGLSLQEIAAFWVELKENNPENLLDYIQTYSTNPAIKEIFLKLEECIKKLNLLPPQRYFHFVLDRFQVKEWAIRQSNRLEILQKIEVLDNFLKSYLQQNEFKKFEDFVERIDAYQREQIEIKYERHIQSENSIKLLTYHKSKGLEFEYVFVYEAGRYSNNNQNKIYIPEVILSKSINEENESKTTEEEKRRLLYVAMTRAKQKLYLVDVLDENKEGKSKNKFKSELNIVSDELQRQTPNIQALVKGRIYAINEEDYIRFNAVNQTNLDITEEQIYENQFTEDRISNFKLSHSSINTYLECPQRFYYEKIISIPSETSLAMTSGNFYHAVLEEYFKQVKHQAEKRTVTNLLDIAHKEIFRYKNFMTEYEFKDVQKSMETNLPILFDQYISKMESFDYGIEDNFEMKIGDAIVTGKIDKWDKVELDLIISDFKTGKKSNAKDKLKSKSEQKIKDELNPTVDERYGGNYWRQAVIYQMLAKAHFPKQAIREIHYVFILPEDNKIESHSFVPNADDETYLKNLILSVHSKIKNKEFGGCKKIDCTWCCSIAERQTSMNE